MKKIYIQPEIEIAAISSEDIMEGSDTFIDVGSLWGENANIE